MLYTSLLTVLVFELKKYKLLIKGKRHRPICSPSKKGFENGEIIINI